MSVVRSLLMSKVGEPGLVSSGTQLIDTGIIPISGESFSMELDTAWHTNDSASRFSGVYYGAGDARRFYVGKANTNRMAYSVGATNYIFGTAGDVSRYKYKIEYDKATGKGNLYLDGVLTNGFDVTSFIGDVPIYLFGTSGFFNQKSVQKIWNAKLYQSGVLVFDGVPVNEGSTEYLATPAPSNCLYDQISGTYKLNVGAGTFGIE